MDAVPEPECAIRNVWCYVKDQIILVDKIEKNPKLGKITNKIARKRNAASRLEIDRGVFLFKSVAHQKNLIASSVIVTHCEGLINSTSATLRF